MKIPILSILLILAVIGGAYYFYTQQMNPQTSPSTEMTPQFGQGQEPQVQDGSGSNGFGDVENPDQPVSSEMITISELSTHNTPTDCWIAVQGKVYDMSNYGEQHSGGPDALYPNCGTDGTQAFLSRGGLGAHPDRVLQQLAPRYVGDLAQ